jgi:hypothetical protein
VIFFWFALAGLQTVIVDDPYQTFVVYVTAIPQENDNGDIVFTGSSGCYFMYLKDPTIVSRRGRGGGNADTFYQFDIHEIYENSCSQQESPVDLRQATFFGGLRADVSTMLGESACSGGACIRTQNVSVRLTNGMAETDGWVSLRFGRPYSDHITTRLTYEDYMEHRTYVLADQ